LVALKVAVSAWVIHAGFTHISDDDYARVTLAQTFVQAPCLDPTGTSWLPFPFWLNGTAMAITGRSLAVARGVAVASSAAGVGIVYGTLLRTSIRRWVAWCGVALAMCAPWSAWLGVATVPEALTASLIATGSICLAAREHPVGRGREGAHLRGAVALLVASLSRYEAWPVALAFAIGCTLFAVRGRSGRARALDVAASILALAGPVAWLAWNAHAHGDPLHFLARVAAYRLRMTSAGDAAGWTLYPEAFVQVAPLTLALTACGAAGLLIDPELRRRWAAPLLAMAALFVFLVEGDLHSAAPTHHPERALIAVFWVGTIFGVDGIRSFAVRFVWSHPKREAVLVSVATALMVASALSWPSRVADYPARSTDEDRRAQIARGTALRERRVAHLVITPCAYEHFALIAAYEAPEHVTLATRDAAHASTSTPALCPDVEER
jgi:hypothetical protein